MRIRLIFTIAAVLCACSVAVPGCDKKLPPEECDKLRGQAFELLNKAQPCASDADCRQSEWPGCERPVNGKTVEAIKQMKTTYTEGKCEEKKMDCRKAPTVYCKQGLCVHKEAAMKPPSEITIQQ
jgi:hypothetical protein